MGEKVERKRRARVGRESGVEKIVEKVKWESWEIN